MRDKFAQVLTLWRPCPRRSHLHPCHCTLQCLLTCKNCSRHGTVQNLRNPLWPYKNDTFTVHGTQTMPQARCKVLNKIIATIPDKKSTWQPIKPVEMQRKLTGSLRKTCQTFLYSSTNDKLFTGPRLILVLSNVHAGSFIAPHNVA